MKTTTKKFDVIMPMSLLALGLLSSGYAAKLVVSDIPNMSAALNQPKLVPMPEVLEFNGGVAVVKGGK